MSSSDRMLALLSLFSLERSELTVEEAAELLGSSLRTTYRYVRSLSLAGLLAPAPGGRHVLGPTAVELDWLIRNTDALTLAAGPTMAALAEAAPVPAVILLCRLYDNQVMCISQHPAGAPPFASSYQRGRPMPLFRGAASKAILACLPRRTVRRLHAQHLDDMAASGLGVTLAEVQASLSSIREAGICSTSGELDAGLTGLAAAIPASAVSPIGSLAVVVADGSLTSQAGAILLRLLKTGAEQIAAALPAVEPATPVDVAGAGIVPEADTS